MFNNSSLKLKILKAVPFILGLLMILHTGLAQSAINGYKKVVDGVVFSLEKGGMKIHVCSDDIIQVQYTILDSMPGFNSLVVNNRFGQNSLSTQMAKSGCQ